MNKQDLTDAFNSWIDSKPDDAQFTIFKGVAWNFNIYCDWEFSAAWSDTKISRKGVSSIDRESHD